MAPTPLPTTRTMRLATALPLLGEVLIFTGTVDWQPRWPVRGAFLLLCAGALVTAVGWGRARPGRGAVATIAALSAVALPSSIVYLASLDPHGADIPLAGVGVFLLANIGLLVALLAAGGTDRPAAVSR